MSVGIALSAIEIYMDASRLQELFGDDGQIRLQVYIRPVFADHSPAGPDGFR
jgi:hypothetical protein